MYYIQSKKSLGHNRGVLYLEHMSVYVQYIINTYVIECCSKIIILYCGVRSSYPMWAIPCVLVGYGHVE